eukprot:972816_1
MSELEGWICVQRIALNIRIFPKTDQCGKVPLYRTKEQILLSIFRTFVSNVVTSSSRKKSRQQTSVSSGRPSHSITHRKLVYKQHLPQKSRSVEHGYANRYNRTRERTSSVTSERIRAQMRADRTLWKSKRVSEKNSFDLRKTDSRDGRVTTLRIPTQHYGSRTRSQKTQNQLSTHEHQRQWFELDERRHMNSYKRLPSFEHQRSESQNSNKESVLNQRTVVDPEYTARPHSINVHKHDFSGRLPGTSVLRPLKFEKSNNIHNKVHNSQPKDERLPYRTVVDDKQSMELKYANRTADTSSNSKLSRGSPLCRPENDGESFCNDNVTDKRSPGFRYPVTNMDFGGSFGHVMANAYKGSYFEREMKNITN